MNTQKSALFTRDFTLVVIGQIISLFGNAILHFALPLVPAAGDGLHRPVRGGERLFLCAYDPHGTHRRDSCGPGPQGPHHGGAGLSHRRADGGLLPAVG